MGDIEVVCFDLETTGFGNDAEIIQIAACTWESRFNIYITPTKPVHPKATEVNGLELYNGCLYLHNKYIPSVPAAHAFDDFIDYLSNFNGNVVLVAHNCFGFDMPKILDLAEELGSVNELEDLINGFSDSLVILRSVLQDQRGGKGSFTLKALVEDYLPYESIDNLHNAERDVQLLQSLLFNSALHPISDEQIMEPLKTIEHYFYRKQLKTQKYYM